MPRIFQMADDFAERFAFEPSRVTGIVKALRDADLIKVGARGVNAPDATPLDAARILIAMMLRVKHHEVAEGVRLFGHFPVLRAEHVETPNDAPETAEAAIAGVLGWCQHPHATSDTSRHFEVRIDRDRCFIDVILYWMAKEDDPRWEEEEGFDGIDKTVQLRYLHPAFSPSLEKNLPPAPELLAAWRHYRSGFHEVPTLDSRDLIEIGQVLGGHAEPMRSGK